MEFNVQVRKARQLFTRLVHDFLADNHHVGFFYCYSNVIAGEVFRQEGEFVQVFTTPELRRWKKVLNEIQTFVERRNIDDDFAFEASKKSLVNFPENLFSASLESF